MKVLFFSLLLMNLVFYVWQTSKEPEEPKPSWQASSANTIRELLLLREMDPDQLQSIPPPPPPAETPPTTTE